MGAAEARLLSASIDRIGLPGSRMRITDGGGMLLEQRADLPGHEPALQALFDALRERPEAAVAGVAHRIVQGDERHDAPRRVTDSLIEELEALAPLGPG